MKALFSKILSLFFCISLLNSCSSLKKNETATPKPPFSSEFESGEYKVIRFDKHDVEAYGLTILVSPSERLISGFSGCNNYQVNYLLENKELKLGNITSSDMYCEKTQTLENNFLQYMSKSNRFILNENQLILTDKDKNVFIIAEKIEKK